MQINTRDVFHIPNGIESRHCEAWNAGICDGKPGDLIGTGLTPLDAIADLVEKTRTMLARVEAEPPVDVHLQLRDAKALLGRLVTSLEKVSVSSSFLRHDARTVEDVARAHRDASLFLLEHGQ